MSFTFSRAMPCRSAPRSFALQDRRYQVCALRQQLHRAGMDSTAVPANPGPFVILLCRFSRTSLDKLALAPGRRASIRGSTTPSIWARCSAPQIPFIRLCREPDENVAVVSSNITATSAPRNVRAIHVARLLTVLASSLAILTTHFFTSSAVTERF